MRLSKRLFSNQNPPGRTTAPLSEESPSSSPNFMMQRLFPGGGTKPENLDSNNRILSKRDPFYLKLLEEHNDPLQQLPDLFPEYSYLDSTPSSEQRIGPKIPLT